MKKWLPTLMLGTLLLYGCNSTPPTENPPIDFPNNNNTEFIRLDAPAPNYSDNLNEFRSKISVKLRRDLDHFTNIAEGNSFRQDQRYQHFSNLVDNCIVRLGDVMVPLLDPYLEAHEALDIAKQFPNDVAPDALNTLKTDLEEIVNTLDPVSRMPEDVDEFLFTYAKYLRTENDLLGEEIKAVGTTPNILAYNKALIDCTDKIMKGYDDATIIKCADNCLALLDKVGEDNKLNGNVLDLHKKAFEAVKNKLSKDSSKTSKTAPNTQTPATPADKQPTTANQMDNPPTEGNAQPNDAASKEDNIAVGSVISTRSGLKYTILEQGSGPQAKHGDTVMVHYIGRFPDGTIFDSSYDRQYPFEFPLGSGYVIAGWDIGITGMRIGEKRQLEVPPHLGYGRDGSGPIPGNATLMFEVELVKIK